MKQFCFSQQSVLSTWFLRMYVTPLWCRWEAKLVWAREVKVKNCLSGIRSRVIEDLRMHGLTFYRPEGQLLLVYCWFGSLSWLAAGSVSACILHGEHALRVRGSRMIFSFQQERAVRMQLCVALELTLISHCVMFCVGTKWSFAPYLKSCGKPNNWLKNK